MGFWVRCLAAGLIAGAPMLGAVPSSANESGVAEPTLGLPGNPSTGYRWVLNETASSGLETVVVEMLGYGPPETDLIGAPAIFGIGITCAGTGEAVLQFDYLSPDNSTVAESEIRKITCR
jgi:predicted secreted protein